MRRRSTALLARIAIPAVLAGVSAHAQMDMDAAMGRMQGGSPPPDARDPHAYSDGIEFTRGEARPKLHDRMPMRSILVDRLEASRISGETVVPYDLEARFGTTYDGTVLKAEGDFESGDLAEARTELLWGHAVAPYWDTQLGIRHDSGEGPSRTWVAAGIEGLAPYRFDLEITGYVGESSRTALRVDASYDLLITQRIILEPRLEATFYGKDDLERGRGSGLSEVALALRLRYEIRRELAPYIGVEWTEQRGGTEELTRGAGRDPSESRIMLGLRFWF